MDIKSRGPTKVKGGLRVFLQNEKGEQVTEGGCWAPVVCVYSEERQEIKDYIWLRVANNKKLHRIETRRKAGFR